MSATATYTHGMESTLPAIKIWNTLTHRKEHLRPREDQQVRIYACGVTVYDHCHVGHAMQALVFDLLVNVLRREGYRVTYVRNFTDVDDKIIARSQELSISPHQLAAAMIASCQRDFKALNLTAPDHEPRVSTHIAEIIAMIDTLIERGYAYASEAGNVYFRVRQFPNYGELSNCKIEELQRAEPHNDDKEDALDFALWKADTVAGASWPSPWGVGRPGWHIECSAMSMAYLGKSFDIHGGGRDLIFPHHENELAQSVCANDSPYASLWMHSGLVTVDGRKMSKSLHNHITIAQFLRDWSPEVLRLAVFTHHYRSNVDFSPAFLRLIRRRVLYYCETLVFLHKIADRTQQKILTAASKAVYEKFMNALRDDLNTPAALAQLHIACKKANELRRHPAPAKDEAAQLALLISRGGELLGIVPSDPQAYIAATRQEVLQEHDLSEQQVQDMIAERDTARQAGNYRHADALRATLQEQGIDLQDTPDGTTWTIGYA